LLDIDRRIIMKAIAFLCATLSMASAIAGELVSYGDGNTIRLADSACTSEKVLSQVEPEFRTQFRAASADLQGKQFTACWHITPDGAHLIYEDGDQGLVPLARLKPLLSI
jgi:hypothetical protein